MSITAECLPPPQLRLSSVRTSRFACFSISLTTWAHHSASSQSGSPHSGHSHAGSLYNRAVFPSGCPSSPHFLRDGRGYPRAPRRTSRPPIPRRQRSAASARRHSAVPFPSGPRFRRRAPGEGCQARPASEAARLRRPFIALSSTMKIGHDEQRFLGTCREALIHGHRFATPGALQPGIPIHRVLKSCRRSSWSATRKRLPLSTTTWPSASSRSC